MVGQNLLHYIVVERLGQGGLSVSPDFSRVLYARCDQCEADMLVENCK